MITENLKFVEEGLALLTSMFKGRPVTEGILASWLSQVQKLENAIFDVIEARYLDTAINAQLDSLGDLVAEPRLGRGDVEYRKSIKTKILVLRSQGKGSGMLEIVGRITNKRVELRYIGFAAAQVIINDILTTQETRVILRYLPLIRPLGVRVDFVYTQWDPARTIIWGSSVGTTGQANGFDTSVGTPLDRVAASAQRMK